MTGENLKPSDAGLYDGSTAEPPYTWDEAAGVRRYGLIGLSQVRTALSPDLPGTETIEGVLLTEQESQAIHELPTIVIKREQ